MIIDEKIKSIVLRRKFVNFWECFDYFKLASYSEIDAMMIASEFFGVWDGVLNVAKKKPDSSVGYWSSGATTGTFVSSGITYIGGVDLCQEDDLIVKIFFMTSEANPRYKDLYKSYIETREYEEVPELEPHFKCVTMKLETELGIKLFNNGFEKLN